MKKKSLDMYSYCLPYLPPKSFLYQILSLNIYIDKLSFNFNYNLVESWDVYILNFPSHPPTHPEKYRITSASTANFDYNFNYNF